MAWIYSKEIKKKKQGETPMNKAIMMSLFTVNEH